MAEKTLYIKELNCEACEKMIRKIAIKNSVKINNVDFKNKTANLEGSVEDMGKTATLLNSMGYAVSFESIPKKGRGFERLLKFMQGTVAGSEEYIIQNQSLKLFFLSTALLFILTFAITSINLFEIAKYSFYAYLSAFGIGLLISTAYHISAYFDYFTHMNGMMVGMTLGMSAGFLAGAIIGATNGMFIGSIAGMIAGIAIGAYWGNCCGIMGILEGFMGGVMAGTMGAMLSVMMVFDHLNEFLAILFFSFAMILGGLNYMVYKETLGEKPRKVIMLGPILIGILGYLSLIFVISFFPHALSLAISGN